MTAELAEAATAYSEAPKRLRAAIVKAAQQGATDLEIAQAIDFAYTPDYIGRIVREAIGPRPRGRRKAPKAAPDMPERPATE